MTFVTHVMLHVHVCVQCSCKQSDFLCANVVRVSRKSRTRVSYRSHKSVPQECTTRVSDKCPTRGPFR